MPIHFLEPDSPFFWFYENIVFASAASVFWALKNPYFYAAVAIILCLEKVFPAKPVQKTLSVGFFQDAVWFIVQMVLKVVVIAFYVGFLTGIYKKNFDFMTIQGASDLSPWIKYPLWLLVVDFFDWFNHWVRHKVPWFWQFHKVHHSQRELSLFTDLRYHAVEYLLAHTVSVFPLLMLQADLYSIIGVSAFHDWYTRLYHANIRSNYGFLRYILVTPQSHRVHHSVEKQHFDKNFGVIFSFWDRLFGTQYHGCEEYPDTGISDGRFSAGKNKRGWSLLLEPISQHLLPFRIIYSNLVLSIGGNRRGGP